MTTITVFKEKTDDSERREIAVQPERIYVVTQDPFMAVRGFVKGMMAVLREEAETIKIRYHQPVNEPEQRRLIEEDATLLDRNSQTERSVRIAMVIVGADTATRLPNARQRVGKVVRDRQLYIEAVRDRLESIGRRLEG